VFVASPTSRHRRGRPALLSPAVQRVAIPAAALAIVLPIFCRSRLAVWPATPSPGRPARHAALLLARPSAGQAARAKLIALIVYTLSAVILVAVTAYLTDRLFGAQPVAATPGA